MTIVSCCLSIQIKVWCRSQRQVSKQPQGSDGHLPAPTAPTCPFELSALRLGGILSAYSSVLAVAAARKWTTISERGE